MKLLTQTLFEKLLKNGNPNLRYADHRPVVKLFAGGSCTWLLTQIDPLEQGLAFGLCDLGMGQPELGYVELSELEALKFPHKVERDKFFDGKFPISVYARAARSEQRITENETVLLKFDAMRRTF